MATIDPTLREVLRSRLGREPTHKEMCDAAVGGTPSAPPTRLGWEHFDYVNILSEASMRLAAAHRSTAEAITTEMRTLEYWTAHVAHANAAAITEGALLDILARPAVLAERRACAEITKDRWRTWHSATDAERQLCNAIAAAILARG